MKSTKKILSKVDNLLTAYQEGKLGDTTMPEDTHPKFNSREEKLLYFTLPMALNYQRNSYKLWESALATWNDKITKEVFNLESVITTDIEILRKKLLKHRLALQPNKHIDTWLRISQTIYKNWGTIEKLLEDCNYDFLELKEVVQHKQKKGFPYLSGPKIFNYWSYTIQEYADVELGNRSFIEIAPDTHVIQASAKLGVIKDSEIGHITREEISLRWREILTNTGIDPIDVHSPLWFWSRNGFNVDI
jgi:hypothetical protein